jgi:hypothetical protein
LATARSGHDRVAGNLQGYAVLFDTKGHRFARELIMLNVRWYLAYKLS